MANEKVKGPASYFPSIEKNYGKPIAHWQDLIRKSPLTKHMELVNWPRPWTPEQSRDRLADYAGLVRCEVTAAIGLRGATDIADRVTSILPKFAGRPSDPRAPQNLAPVGGLETLLRHRMGEPLLIRRALLNYLCTVDT